ncbi:MAG: NAD(P)-dependent oxidoreductase [Polyangiales bacterium]
MIAFLGMGLLGSNFVRALRKRGEPVRVWNRTADKARALASTGAEVLDDVAEAVRGASRVHIVVSDDAAVDDVLARAEPGFGAGTVIVDHTTTSADGARARTARFQQRGLAYQHAPVFMAPQHALESTGLMLVSGEKAGYEALRPALEPMTGKLIYLGDDPGRAAGFKLLGNLYLMFMTAGVTELLTLGKALGIAPDDAASLFSFFNPGAATIPRMQRVLAADYANPSWELSMARKDARLMVEAGERGGAPLAVLPALTALMDGYIARGHGHDDWTVIAKDALSR